MRVAMDIEAELAVAGLPQIAESTRTFALNRLTLSYGCCSGECKCVFVGVKHGVSEIGIEKHCIPETLLTRFPEGHPRFGDPHPQVGNVITHQGSWA